MKIKKNDGSLIVVAFLVIGCISENTKQQAVAVYDEPALKSFVLTTTKPDESNSLRLIDSLLAVASNDSTVFHKTITYLETPFGNPNSAYRNENLYAAILRAKMRSEWVDSTTKHKTRDKLFLLMQNRPGSIANDFSYETAAGYKKKMYDVKADYLLLYFNNPGCDACKQTKEALAGSDIITQKIKAGQLKVLSIYTDKDEKLWLDHLNEYPKSWIQGRDDDEYLRRNKVYDLGAIPTIYLLDRHKNVLLKDAVEIAEIEAKLSGNF